MQALPTLRQLQFFLALVRRESFSRAAADCFVSQSTLSSAIKELEAILDCHLVDRSTRRFSLTPAGRDVARRAASILSETEDLARSAAARKPLEGAFQLGVIPTIAPFLLPRIAPALRRAFPKLELYLREDLTAALAERLVDGSIDAALIALPYDLPGIDWIAVGEDPFFFAAPSGSPLAAKKTVDAGDLKGATLLLLEDGHCLREHALDACKLHDSDVYGSFSATSLFTLTQMVRAGLGATLLPKMAVDAGLAASEDLVVRPLAARDAMRTIGVAWRKGSGRREDCELLAAAIKAETAPAEAAPAGRKRGAPNTRFQ
jgi:LysR family transcriptional regulator, hydrogen peroxide-inducible genes activator